jgi:hypothetical protein
VSDKLRHWKDRIVGEHLARIEDLFAPEQPKVTLLIRTPWLKDGGILITNDSTEAALAEFNRLAGKEVVR